MKHFVTIYYWVRIAALAIIVILALLSAIRMMRRHKFAAWHGLVFVVAALVISGGMVWIVRAPFNVVWAVVLLVLGAAAGVFAGGNKFSQEQSHTYLRRSPLAPLVWAVGMILVAMTLLFGTSYLVALAMLVLAFALGTVIGQVVKELVGSMAGAGAAETVVQTPAPKPAEESAAVTPAPEPEPPADASAETAPASD